MGPGADLLEEVQKPTPPPARAMSGRRGIVKGLVGWVCGWTAAWRTGLGTRGCGLGTLCRGGGDPVTLPTEVSAEGRGVGGAEEGLGV